MTAIALYHCRNPQPFAPGDLCGCIRCRAVFPAEKAVKTPEGDTECPGCGGCTVIGGEAGNPPAAELLCAMQAYFFPESPRD